MHREISQNLEKYLNGDKFRKSASELPTEFHSHLGECEECFTELNLLEEQARLLRSLRGPTNAEPRAGFYARVMERIEAQPASIWSVFLDRRFGPRLAVGSAALIALLGAYLIASEPRGPESATPPAVVSSVAPEISEARVQSEDDQDGLGQRQRDEVLVDLASYHQ